MMTVVIKQTDRISHPTARFHFCLFFESAIGAQSQILRPSKSTMSMPQSDDDDSMNDLLAGGIFSTPTLGGPVVETTATCDEESSPSLISSSSLHSSSSSSSLMSMLEPMSLRMMSCCCYHPPSPQMPVLQVLSKQLTGGAQETNSIVETTCGEFCVFHKKYIPI